MKELILHREKILYPEIFIRSCPFSALEIRGGEVVVTAACRLCGACVRGARGGECEIVDSDGAAETSAPESASPQDVTPPRPGRLVIHNDKIPYKEVFIRCCPFSALAIRDGLVVTTPACRLCGACVRRARNGECEMI